MFPKEYFPDELHLFTKGIGFPNSLAEDPSGYKTSKHVNKLCNQVGTSLGILEESHKWENWYEIYIGLFKESTQRDIRATNFTKRLWNYRDK